MSDPSISVIVPVYREGAAITQRLDTIAAVLPADAEVLVVFDEVSDPTAPYIEAYQREDARIHPVLNTYARGPAAALRYGFDVVASSVVVVAMADGSDDAEQIVELADLVRSGAVIAAASRYMRGGRQFGGPVVKRSLSRLAGVSLHLLARVPIHDPTNAFKAYWAPFVREVGVDSTRGFEISLELVAKAHRLRLPQAEVPTIWRDRTEGESHFDLRGWLPEYLRWYRFAFGPKLSIDELRRRSARG